MNRSDHGEHKMDEHVSSCNWGIKWPHPYIDIIIENIYV